MSKPYWQGVFPAITTQLSKEQEVDYSATMTHVEALVESRITGIIMLGSLGENQTLTPEEKRKVVEATVKHVKGRIPVLSGVAETTTAGACKFATDCEALGADGLMVMPSMLYKGDPAETMAHFRAVAASTKLPIMIYNNPLSYANDITPQMFAELSNVKNFVALKESAGDTRRITDLHNTVGGRYAIFTGVDNLMLESAVLGLDGWVAGSGIAFPKENQYLWELTRRGEWTKALEIYRWFTPLLHLDVSTKFVQYIKLAVQEAGLGKEYVRAPRMMLTGAEREKVLGIIHEGIKKRPLI